LTCVCGKGPSTEKCCGPFIKGEAHPTTAEQLMRSRYAAYALGDIDYVFSSHHPDTVHQADRKGAEEWSAQAEWHGLTVHEASGGESDDAGTVEFTAAYEIQGKLLRHRERAEFRRRNGRWVYYDGEMVKAPPMRREAPKVGRNEPCPCGSGKKYKKCCGR
jgi:SEC-C motif-containing protein